MSIDRATRYLVRTMNKPTIALLPFITVLCVHHQLSAQGFNPTAVDWPVPEGGDVSVQTGPMGFWYPGGGSPVNDSHFWETVDMNGDARPDLVVTGQRTAGWPYAFDAAAQPHWRVFLNNGTGFAGTATDWNLPAGGEHHGLNTAQGYWATDYSSTNDEDNTWTLADMNGDHLPDLVVTAVAGNSYPRAFSPANAPYWKVYLNSGTGFSPNALNWALPQGGIVVNTDVQSFPYFNYLSPAPGCHAWVTRDINGDGLPDLVLTAFEQFSFDAATDPHWKVYLNTGTGFSLTALDHALPPGGGMYTGQPTGYPRPDSNDGTSGPGADAWRLRDMDADGRPDLVLTSAYDGSNYTVYGFGNAPFWKVHLNTGSAFSSSPIEWPVPEGGGYGPVYGFAAMEQDNAWNDSEQTWSVIDLGGDGPPDLVVTSDDDDGSGEIMFGGSQPYWKRFTNLGNGFDAAFTPWSVPVGGLVVPDTGFAEIDRPDASNLGEELWRVFDINGDSLADLVVTGHLPDGIPDEQVFGLGTAPHWRVYLQDDPDSGVPTEGSTGILHVYPNPAQDRLVLEVPGKLVGSRVSLFDAMGHLVLTSQARSVREFLDLTPLPPGMYTVRCGERAARIVKR